MNDTVVRWHGGTGAREENQPDPRTRRPTVPQCCASLYELPITSLLLGDSFHPGGIELTRRLAEAIVVGRGDKVIDVACGRGSSDLMLADSFGCDVVAVDVSQPNLRAIPGARHRRIDPVCGEAHHLPIADGIYDGLICECALCTFTDKSAALGEMHRVLTRGGRIGISDMVLNAPIPEPLAGLMGYVLCIAGAMNRDGYVDAIRKSGFVSVRVRDESDSLIKLIESIEKRIQLAGAMVESDVLELPAQLDDPRPVLEAARDFVRSGGLQYAIFTARKNVT